MYFLDLLQCYYSRASILVSVVIEGQLTPNFNLLAVDSTTLVHYVPILQLKVFIC